MSFKLYSNCLEDNINQSIIQVMIGAASFKWIFLSIEEQCWLTTCNLHVDTLEFEECSQPGLPTEPLPGERDSPPSGPGVRAALLPRTPQAQGKILMKFEEEKRKDINLAFPHL